MQYRLAFLAATVTACLLFTVVPATVVAQDAAEAPAAAPEPKAAVDDAAAKVMAKAAAAYRGIDTYHATTILAFGPKGQPGQDMASIDIALDRKKNSLSIRRPDFLININDGKLQGRFAAFDQRTPRMVYEAPHEGDIRYTDLAKEMPVVESPILPDMVLLLGANPFNDLENLQVFNGAQGKPAGVTGKLGEGVVSAWFDETTGRMTRLSMIVTMPQGEAEMVMRIEEKAINQPLEDNLFTLDTRHLETTPFLRELETGPSTLRLRDKEAPNIKLNMLDGQAFELAAAMKEHDVVILDFWATWCGPCRMSMPMLQRVQKWADAEGLSVQVYLVNMREQRGMVAPFVRQLGLELPVVLDTEAATVDSYLVKPLPTSVMIHGGKISVVHLGVAPDYEETLKADINKLLGRKVEAPVEPAPEG